MPQLCACVNPCTCRTANTNRTLSPKFVAECDTPNAGLLTYILQIYQRMVFLPSQFLSDWLSSTKYLLGCLQRQFRSGFTPDSLFTLYTLSVYRTHCVNLLLVFLSNTITTKPLRQLQKQTKYTKKQRNCKFFSSFLLMECVFGGQILLDNV